MPEPAKNAAQQPQHMPALDGLRGVAILMVVMTHVGGGWFSALSIAQDTTGWSATFDLPAWLRTLSGHGIYGVTLFFAVSAFTLTHSISRGGSLRGYAVRRIGRVGPGYWLAGVGYMLMGGFGPRLWAADGISWSDVMVAATFGSAWHGGASLMVVPGGWSVSCEVAFYASLPFVVWITGRNPWRAAVLTVLSMLCVQVVARYLTVRGGWHYAPEYVHPLAQAPVFLCGITAALLMHKVQVPRIPGLAVGLLAGAVLLLPFVGPSSWYVLPHLSFAAMVSAAIMLAASHPPRFLALAIMRRIGEVSYSIYLLHFALLAPCLKVAELLIPANDVWTFAMHLLLTCITSFGLARLTHRHIEQPALDWATRHFAGNASRLHSGRDTSGANSAEVGTASTSMLGSEAVPIKIPRLVDPFHPEPPLSP